MFPRNVGKQLPNRMVQQPSRPTASSTISRWKLYTTVFVLLRIYLFPIILCDSFIVSCWCVTDFPRKNETIEVGITFGRQYP